MEPYFYTFTAIALLCAIWDFLTFKIPNLLLLSSLFLFAFYVFHMGWMPTHGFALKVFGGALFIGFGFFALKWIGAGDAKFIATSLLWVSATPKAWAAVFTFLIAMSLWGGVLALIYHLGRPTIERFRMWLNAHLKLSENPEIHNTRKLPYGIAVAAGLVTLCFNGGLGL
jgi:prepilin peptidase CpaA